MKNNHIVRYAFLLASLCVMYSAAGTANEGVITVSNKTSIRVDTSYVGGGVMGGALLDPGQTVSGGLPGASGQKTVSVSVDSNYQTIAFCSAPVDTTLPILAVITGGPGTYSCSVQNTVKMTAVLNTTMLNYAVGPVTIVEKLSQDGRTLLTTPQQMAANTVRVIPTGLLSTSPVTVDHVVYAAGFKLVAMCSTKLSFTQNLFYTTVRVVTDPQQRTGYSCSAW